MTYIHGETLIKIAIADDHTMFREALSKQINEWVNCKVILHAGNGKELIDQVHPQNLPELVITDIRMPVMNGYDTILELKKKYPEIKILVLSMYEDKETMLILLKSGAQGFLNKTADIAEIKKAIYEMINREFYFTDQSIARMFKRIWDKGHVSGINELKECEINYLKLLCTGKTDKEIAYVMGITERKTEYIRCNMFDRFAVQSRTQLAVHCAERGLTL